MTGISTMSYREKCHIHFPCVLRRHMDRDSCRVVKCTFWTVPRGVSVTALEGGHTHRRHFPNDTWEGGGESAMGVRNSDACVHRPVKRRLFFLSLHHTNNHFEIFLFYFLPVFISVVKKVVLDDKNIGGAFAPPPCTPKLCLWACRHRHFANNLYETTRITFRQWIQNCFQPPV
jgi:hypothetical protein